MMYSLTMTVASAALSSAYFSTLVYRLRSVGRLRRQVASQRALALTYDDGPSGTVTPKLLDLFQEHHAKATFFIFGILGQNAKKHPEIVDRVVRAGHDRGVFIRWCTIDSGNTYTFLPRAEDVVETLLKRGGGVVLISRP